MSLPFLPAKSTPFVPGGLARERVGALTVVRRQPARQNRPPLGVGLLSQVTAEQHALQHTELLVAIGELYGELVQGLADVGDVAALELLGFERTADRGFCVKIELAVFEFGHFRQSAPEGIEPDHVGIHLPEPDGQRVEGVFGPAARIGNLLATAFQFGCQGFDFGEIRSGCGSFGGKVATDVTASADEGHGERYSNQEIAGRYVDLTHSLQSVPEYYDSHPYNRPS